MKYELDRRAAQVEADIMTHREPTADYTDAMRAYRAFIENGRKAEPGSIEEMVFVTLRESERQRDIVEALLIGDCPDDGAEKALGIPEHALQWYRELFFDTALFRSRLDLWEYVHRDDDGHVHFKDSEPVLTQEEWESRPLKQIAYDCGYHYVLGLVAGSGVYESSEGRSFARDRMMAYLAYAGTQAGHNLVALGRAPSTPENAAAAKENFGILSKAYEQFRDAVPADDTGPTFYEIIFNSEEPEELRRYGKAPDYIDPADIV